MNTNAQNRRPLMLAALILVILVLCAPLGAESWRKITTSKQQIIYPVAMEDLAQQVAEYYERYGSGYIQAPNSNWPVVLNNTQEYANGFVSPMDHVSKWEQGPYALRSPANWYLMLAVHEGFHMGQFDYIKQSPMGRFGSIFGHIGQALPAALNPSWYFEGGAVLKETVTTPYGRGYDGHFAKAPYRFMQAHPEASLNKGLAGYFVDGGLDRYSLGYMILNDVYERKGWQTFSQLGRLDRAFKSFDTDFKEKTGESPAEIYNRIRDSKVAISADMPKSDGIKEIPLGFTTQAELVKLKMSPTLPPEIWVGEGIVYAMGDHKSNFSVFGDRLGYIQEQQTITGVRREIHILNLYTSEVEQVARDNYHELKLTKDGWLAVRTDSSGKAWLAVSHGTQISQYELGVGIYPTALVSRGDEVLFESTYEGKTRIMSYVPESGRMRVLWTGWAHFVDMGLTPQQELWALARGLAYDSVLILKDGTWMEIYRSDKGILRTVVRKDRIVVGEFEVGNDIGIQAYSRSEGQPWTVPMRPAAPLTRLPSPLKPFSSESWHNGLRFKGWTPYLNMNYLTGLSVGAQMLFNDYLGYQNLALRATYQHKKAFALSAEYRYSGWPELSVLPYVLFADWGKRIEPGVIASARLPFRFGLQSGNLHVTPYAETSLHRDKKLNWNQIVGLSWGFAEPDMYGDLWYGSFAVGGEHEIGINSSWFARNDLYMRMPFGAASVGMELRLLYAYWKGATLIDTSYTLAPADAGHNVGARIEAAIPFGVSNWNLGGIYMRRLGLGTSLQVLGAPKSGNVVITPGLGLIMDIGVSGGSIKALLGAKVDVFLDKGFKPRSPHPSSSSNFQVIPWIEIRN